MKIERLGERALLASETSPSSLERQQRIWSVARIARDWRGVSEVVPAMNNLTIFFDDGADISNLENCVRDAWAAPLGDSPHAGRAFEIPVRYGGEDGPDLEEVAQHCNMTQSDVVAAHVAAEYTVYFLGFLPGFAYLGGLDRRLQTPRREEPRLAVPAGSVGIGGEQTGVYSVRAPGGWNIIGRTEVRMFDPSHERATLLAPGDRVRFVPRT